MTSASVSERLGFADLVDKVAADTPRRDTERLLFDDLRPELRARKIGAIRLSRADGTRLPLTEFFAFIRELAAADSNLYKQQVLGGYEVHGTKPPLDVYF